MDVFFRRLSGPCAVVLSFAPCFQRICSSSGRSLECCSFLGAGGNHCAFYTPIHKCSTPRPRFVGWQIGGGFVFVDARPAVCGVDFLDSDLGGGYFYDGGWKFCCHGVAVVPIHARNATKPTIPSRDISAEMRSAVSSWWWSMFMGGGSWASRRCVGLTR